MTIEQEALQLVKDFKNAIDPYGMDDNDRDAQAATILHCEKIREHDKKIADALEAVGIAMDDEYYTNLINAIKNL